MNFQRFIGVFRKLLEKGPVWALSRTKKEFRHPTFPLMKNVMTFVKNGQKELKNLSCENMNGGKNYLTAVYDLNVNPITFDFAAFLVRAEIFANKNNRNFFFLLFVQRDGETAVNKIYSSIIDENSSKWRFENIILPLISLCPACIGYSILPKSSNVSELVKGELVFPEFYDGKYSPDADLKELFGKKNDFIGLQASAQGGKYIQDWKKANSITGNVVTITLRQYGYDPMRNSNVDEWVKFSNQIKKEGFIPVIIPDTDACYEQDPRFEGLVIFRDACWNLGLRMALYEESYLNFFVPSGPATMAFMNNKVKIICMKMIVPGSIEATDDVYKGRGLKIGQRKFEFSEDYQVISWEMDNFDIIRKEFNQFLADCSPSINLSS